ncbi:MAG: hypothetical protein Q9190_003372 [Brigantiaea leucoxantha]
MMLANDCPPKQFQKLNAHPPDQSTSKLDIQQLPKRWKPPSNGDLQSVLLTVLMLAASQKSQSSSVEAAEVQSKARSIETAAYNNASSREEYDKILSDAIGLNFDNEASETHGDHIDVRDLDSASVPHIQLGPYTATYHRSGLFSTVYKARSPTDSSQIHALKLTTPSQCTAPHDPHREARILARVSSNQHIIPLLSTFPLSGGRLILTFPFLPLDLDTLLHPSKTSTTLSAHHLKSHLHDLFSALAHLHPQNVIHRDIKPSNILLRSPSGPAYIADFGIAWLNGDPASEAADQKITDVGTTCYRAPELLFGYKAYGPALDLWAAGCVVAEVVNGEPYGSLFEEGVVGSELGLLASVFKILGTPDEEAWPETALFPDWGKMSFHKFPKREWKDVLPCASESARDLVSQLVGYQSTSRLAAADVLHHAFFKPAETKFSEH